MIFLVTFWKKSILNNSLEQIKQMKNKPSQVNFPGDSILIVSREK